MGRMAAGSLPLTFEAGCILRSLVLCHEMPSVPGVAMMAKQHLTIEAGCILGSLVLCHEMPSVPGRVF